MSLADCLCGLKWLSETVWVFNYSWGLCSLALISVYLPVTYAQSIIYMYNSATKRCCLMSKRFLTGTLLSIRGRMFTDQVMETEDFDPSMPTIERYTTRRVWNNFDFSSQFPPTKCLHYTDYSCAKLTISMAAKLRIENYAGKYEIQLWTTLKLFHNI